MFMRICYSYNTFTQRLKEEQIISEVTSLEQEYWTF